MKGQLGLLNDNSPDVTEKEAFESVLPSLLHVLDESNIPSEMIALDRKKSYSSITFRNGKSLVARLCIRGENSYLSVSHIYHETLPDIAHATTNAKDPNFICIPLVPASSIEKYAEFLAYVLSDIIDKIPKEFDCCAWYKECSDAHKCMSPNRELAMGCGYKKVMKLGRIFYGMNRNVD